MASTGFLPYGRHAIDDEDIRAVVEVLRGDWLTTGPAVGRIEEAASGALGGAHCVAVNSGTAALHCATHALGLGPGDEVVVPALTFAASANAVVYVGATPVFADVDPATLLIDPESAARCIGPRTRAIVAVDYAGQPADYDALRALSSAARLPIIADACHAPGALYKGRPAGMLAEISTFSLHPVKHVTAGEGGIVATPDPDLAARARRFRNHGIDSDHRERHERGTYAYDMVELGFNYRLTDIQAALGTSQFAKLAGWVSRRQELAALYDTLFRDAPHVEPLTTLPDRTNAHHLYVVQLALEALDCDRTQVFQEMRALGIGVNVHYQPVHLNSFYRSRFGHGPGLCPVAERAYERILTLPIFPAMTAEDVGRVVEALRTVVGRHLIAAA